jgi:hypothetical protein
MVYYRCGQGAREENRSTPRAASTMRSSRIASRSHLIGFGA